MLNTIVAFSDSHGNALPKKLLNIIEENTHVFFLGDGIARLDSVLMHKGLRMVKGNCDNVNIQDEQIVEIDGVKILLTHGDKYHVKRDLTSLYMRANELNCTLVFYGHTHFASIDEYNGITFVCPGSTYIGHGTPPSYAYAVISSGKFSVKIVNLI